MCGVASEPPKPSPGSWPRTRTSRPTNSASEGLSASNTRSAPALGLAANGHIRGAHDDFTVAVAVRIALPRRAAPSFDVAQPVMLGGQTPAPEGAEQRASRNSEAEAALAGRCLGQRLRLSPSITCTFVSSETTRSSLSSVLTLPAASARPKPGGPPKLGRCNSKLAPSLFQSNTSDFPENADRENALAATRTQASTAQ